MWISYKLYRAAKDIRKYLDKDNRIEMDNAIDFYGVDSGEAILKISIRLFSKDFMREFWIGNDKDFNKALEEHEALL